MRQRRSNVHAQAHSGQMMVVFALTLVVLIGALALGVDLSRLRTEAENAQHAANAAALAGVPFLATSQTTAFTRAQEEAAKNGMANGARGVVVTPSTVSGYDYRLRVSISESVTLFFAHVLGLGPMRISRTATAEFLPPLGLGSPDYVLGYPAFPTTLITGTIPENFYLNSSGPYDIKENGEPYSPLFESYKYGSNPFNYNSGNANPNPCPCQSTTTVTGTNGTSLTQNVLSHPPSYFTGYNYVIDDPVSNTLFIKLFDPFAEGTYDPHAASWDGGHYTTSVAPPTSVLAPSDIQPMAGSTCVLGIDLTTSSRCRSELIDATGATYSQFGHHPTTLQFTLSGPYHTDWDPTYTPITTTPPTSGDIACANPGDNCVIQQPSFTTGEDPATPACMSGASCQRSSYAYKFINYAVIHGPGIFKLNVNAVVNATDTAYGTTGTYGTEHNSYGVAVCNTVNDPTYSPAANPLGLPSNPIASDPMTTTSNVSTTAGLTTPGWNPLSCPSPNDPTTCPNPRFSPPSSCVHLYAAGTMPVYNLLSAGSSLIPLGYIPPDYAGKAINLDLFDPGDITGSGSSGCPVPMATSNCIEVLTPAGDTTHVDGAVVGTDPNDGSQFLPSLPYSWYAAPDVAATGYYSSPGTTSAPASQPLDVTTTSKYNGTWIHLKIPIPSNYADMVAQYGGYWKILYRIGGAGHDATTWGLNVAGSTVHLVAP